MTREHGSSRSHALRCHGRHHLADGRTMTFRISLRGMVKRMTAAVRTVLCVIRGVSIMPGVTALYLDFAGSNPVFRMTA